MEKTRIYIDKGEEPLFFDLAPHIHDRVPADRREPLLDLVRRGEVLVPAGNRAGLGELVDTAAQDAGQSLYRVLWLEHAGAPQACLGFGMVAATDDTYDCFGVAATSPEWAGQGLAALGKWLTLAKARLARYEVDSGNAALAEASKAHGFREEGRLDDFYKDGVHQLLMVWRPGR